MGAVTLAVNGQAAKLNTRAGTYATLQRTWQPGDVIDLFLPIRPRLTAAHPRATALRGSLAIERGPLVYCMEEPDQPGVEHWMYVSTQPQHKCGLATRPFGGVITVEAQGSTAEPYQWEGQLYLPAVEIPPVSAKPFKLTAIPYYS